jgi:hypothetical protein
VKKLKNKTVLIVIAVVVAVLILGGAGSMFVLKKAVNKLESKVANKIVAEKVTNDSGVFGSIKDALAKSLSMQCDYSVGSTKTSVYIKSGNIRFESANSVGIFKDNKIWTWNPTTKQGMLIPQSVTNRAQQVMDKEKLVEDLESQKQFCKVSMVSDSQFEVPADVTFQDLGKLFEKLPVASPSEQ